MFNLESEKKRLLERNPELKQETMSLFEESQEAPLLRFASVVDNRDPMCMGRLKVTFGPDDVTGWIQAIALGAAKGSGWWMLPDIGQQVVVSFVGMERQQPVVLGCIWSEVHRPPKPSSGEPRDAFLIQWGKHRVEFLTKDGNETITVSAANGKMRLEMSSAGGIKLINELGGIKIKCRKLKIIGREGVNITAKKSVTFKAKDMLIKAQDISMKSGGEMTFKASNIQIEASRGITAEGKQMASSQSNVQGFDVHKMLIPSGTGTAVVPLPHPFIGKMSSDLSPDVKLNGYQAATEGSVAKHNNEDHLQLPGTISFEQPPSRKGKVTGGTVESVKINGKPVAVVGSTVSTCNDIGTSDNSAIMAPGAHMPMPAIIHPKNTKEWKEGREAEKGELPEFMDVRAGAGSAKEGEQVKITALVKGIADGNQITFHVRPLGQPANTNIPPLAELRATVEGGAAETGYAHKHPKGKELPEGEPRLYAVAHSAWCPPKSGGEWEVVLLRPEIAVLEVGKMASSGEGDEASFEASEVVEYGEQFVVRVQTKEVEDGGIVHITAACRLIDFSESKSVEVKGGKAEAIFETASISRQTLELLEDGDEFALKCTAETADNRAKKDGGQMQVVFTHIQEYTPAADSEQYDNEFILESADGAYSQTHDVLSEGELKGALGALAFTDVLPGKTYSLAYRSRKTGETSIRFSDVPFSKLNLKSGGS